MGNCIFCGEPAGWFMDSHDECKVENEKAMVIDRKIWDIIPMITESLKMKDRFHNIELRVDEISDEIGLSDEYWEILYMEAFDDFISSMTPSALTKDIEMLLKNYVKYFRLTEVKLNKFNNSWSKFEKNLLLKKIFTGRINKSILPVNNSFNLLKKELLIYSFNNIPYYELQKQKEFIASSVSFGTRGTGAYASFREFRGRSVEFDRSIFIARGQLGISNLHLYFSSNVKSLRIKIVNMVSVQLYSDGVTIQTDKLKAIPQTFMFIDPFDAWFLHHLLINMKNIEIEL